MIVPSGWYWTFAYEATNGGSEKVHSSFTL